MNNPIKIKHSYPLIRDSASNVRVDRAASVFLVEELLRNPNSSLRIVSISQPKIYFLISKTEDQLLEIYQRWLFVDL